MAVGSALLFASKTKAASDERDRRPNPKREGRTSSSPRETPVGWTDAYRFCRVLPGMLRTGAPSRSWSSCGLRHRGSVGRSKKSRAKLTGSPTGFGSTHQRGLSTGALLGDPVRHAGSNGRPSPGEMQASRTASLSAALRRDRASRLLCPRTTMHRRAGRDVSWRQEFGRCRS